MDKNHCNTAIHCTVEQCANHCCSAEYCSLDSIHVGTHEASPLGRSVHRLHEF